MEAIQVNEPGQVDPEAFESPLVRRGMMLFRGKILWPSQIRRMVEYRPHLRELSAKGLNIGQASRLIGFCPSTIRSWSAILGIQFKKGRRRKGFRYDKSGWHKAITEGVAKGMTLEKLGIQLDVPLINIARYCEQNGLNWMEMKRAAKIKRHEQEQNRA
jgi:hypothetical protein